MKRYRKNKTVNVIVLIVDSTTHMQVINPNSNTRSSVEWGSEHGYHL